LGRFNKEQKRLERSDAKVLRRLARARPRENHGENGQGGKGKKKRKHHTVFENEGGFATRKYRRRGWISGRERRLKGGTE